MQTDPTARKIIDRATRRLARETSRREWWIDAAALKNRGWLAMPRHAREGRHASPATRRGRRVLAVVFGAVA